MKNLTILFALIFALTAQISFAHTSDGVSKIQIKGVLVGCAETDTIYLYQWYGINMRQLHTTTLTEKKGTYNFTFKLANIPEGFYAIGTSPENTKPLILGTESKITLKGNCETIKGIEVIGSSANTYYQELMKENGNINNEFMRLLKQMRAAMRSPKLKVQVDSQFAVLDARRIALYETAKKTSSFMGKSQALVTYLSFVNNGGDYKTEGEYFANEYFKYVDFSDAALQYTPALLQQMQSYANTIAQVGFDPTKQSEYVDGILNKTAANPAAYQAALLGTIIGYSKAKDKTNFVKYGKLFLDKYPDYDPTFRQNIQTQIKRSSSLITGAEAPEISQQTPDGKVAKLSDLRGKVVLIDFWASWCGPCRKANPAVVALYDKYKDEGFEVFGVSLDSDKKRWVAAIKKDKLTWTNVSDLKKWKSDAAADYGVRSIPTTILIDKEGKILAKNLKGAALEAKIKEALK